MSEIVKASLKTPGEFAAALPLILGFTPTESLVLTGTKKTGGFGLTVRIDLPAPGEGVDWYVHQATGYLLDQDPASWLCAVYTDGPNEHADLVAALHLAMGDVPCQEVVRVTSGRWYSYHCDLPCCPPDGLPLPTTSTALTRIKAANVLDNRLAAPTRGDLDRVFAPTPDSERMLAVHNALAGGFLEALAEEPELTLEATLAAWREAAGAGRSKIPAALTVSLSCVGLRDRLLAQAAQDEHLGQGLLSLLAGMIPNTPTDWVAPLLTSYAIVNYVTHGGGAATTICLDRALAADANYRMASLMVTALGVPIPPDTMRQVLIEAVAS